MLYPCTVLVYYATSHCMYTSVWKVLMWMYMTLLAWSCIHTTSCYHTKYQIYTNHCLQIVLNLYGQSSDPSLQILIQCFTYIKLSQLNVYLQIKFIIFILNSILIEINFHFLYDAVWISTVIYGYCWTNNSSACVFFFKKRE